MSVTNDLLERSDAAFHILQDYAATRTNKKQYFGDNGEGWIQYNSSLDKIEIGGKSVTFSGGESALYQDFAETATPAAPAADVLRIFATDVSGITTLKTIDSAGTVSSIGSGTTIDVSKFAGANLGAKLTAALASVTSGVLDARNVLTNQTISSTVTVNKSVEILWPAGTITVSASPGIYITQGVGIGNGSIMEGAGPGATTFQGAGGVTPIFRVEGYDVLLKDFRVKYTSLNATNCSVQIQNGGNTNVLRVHLDNLDLDGGGDYTTGLGDGVTYQICFVGSVMRCVIHGFGQGIRTKDDGFNSTNAVMIQSNRIVDNKIAGIQLDNTGDSFVHHNTIEGNGSYGLWMKKGFFLSSIGNHYEQVGSGGALANVKIEGISDGISRSYTFLGDVFSGTSGGQQDIILGAGTNQAVDVRGGQCGSGFNIGAGQPTATLDTVYGGVTNLGASSIRTGDSWAGSGVTLTFPSWNGITFAKELTNTGAGSVEYWVAVNDLNPAGNSASTFLGLEIVNRIKNANVRNFTGSISGATITGAHQGTGLASDLRGATIVASQENVAAKSTQMAGLAVGTQSFSNSATHLPSAIGLYVLTPVNSGTQIVDSYTGVYVTDAVAVAGITNAYAIQTAGGKLNFVLSHTSDTFTVVTPNDTTAFVVSGNTNTVGIGQAPDAASKVAINGIRTATTAWTNLTNVLDLNPTANTAVSFSGYASTTFVDATNNKNLTGVVTGVGSTVDHRGSGTLSSGWAAYNTIINTNAGILIDAEVYRAAVFNLGAGSITSASNFVGAAPTISAGSIGTFYGLLLFESTTAVTNYTIYTTGGLCVFNVGQTATSDFWVSGQHVTYGMYFDVSADSLGIGTNLPAEKLDVVGAVQFTMGTGTMTAKAVGVAWVDTTAVGNIGAGEDILITHDISANSLSAVKKGIRVTMSGTFANNANAKTLKIYFGSAVLLTSTLAVSIAGTWKVVYEAFETGANAQDFTCTLITNGAAGVAINQLAIGTATQTTNAAITIKATGTATSDNDVVQELLVIEAIN